jgi:hypothetical protein
MVFGNCLVQIPNRCIAQGIDKILVGQDKDRNLKPISQIKSPVGQIKSLFNSSGSINNSGKITMPAVENKMKITLFGTGRQPCAGTGPLCYMDDKRNFRDTA